MHDVAGLNAIQWLSASVGAGVLATAAYSVWKRLTAGHPDWPDAETDLSHSPAETEPLRPGDDISYWYYIYEDDFFRGTSMDGATEVLRTGNWVPYKGDPFEPVVLGKRIGADALPGTAAALAGPELTKMTRQEILAARARIRRQIEILEVPARPRGRPTPRVTQLIADLKAALGEIEIQLAKREQKHQA